ncbi:MAG: crossover junction endodeoxyribonuclease RuvC [Desulfovibrionaceae bacterium]|nr:crossover junction endodeoxyribonuclease RuvC [Desulfovibrionaceae bacterium]
MASLTVIGIDPGSRNTGWGVVREQSGVLELIDCGVIRPPAKAAFSTRLAAIFHALREAISRCQPEEAAIEQAFQGINAATALKLGQARGVACAACASFDLTVSDYPPSAVKKALVGVGGAEKEQVAFMVGRLLNHRTDDWALDTSDALAVAICHLTMRRFSSRIAGA